MSETIKRILSVVGRELLDTLRGFAQFYATYARLAWRRRGSLPGQLLAVAVFAVPLIFLLVHPLLPAWLKIAGAVLIALAAVFVTRDAIARAKAAHTEMRPVVRGAILGLYPFFLVSVVALFWGLVELLPTREGTGAWLVFANSSFPEGGLGYAAQISVATLGVIDWWCYGLRITLGISLEATLESVSALFSSEPLVVARIMAWHPVFAVLETLVNLIAAALFVGIIADIALAVQNKVRLGDEIGEAASENYGLTLVTAATKLGPDAPARIVQAQLGLATLRKHARQALKRHLRQAAKDSEPQTRARAARALGELGEPASARALAEALSRDPSPEVRAAAARALGAVADKASVPRLVQALTAEEEANVRQATARALLTWRPAAAAEPLFEALEAGVDEPASREELARVLATLIEAQAGVTREEGVARLVQATRQEHPAPVAAGAFDTLAALAQGSRTDERAHLAGRTEPPGPFAEAARNALARLDGKAEPAATSALRLLGALGGWLRREEASVLGEQVREGLVTALSRTEGAESSPEARSYLAQLLLALGRVGSAQALSQVEPYLEHNEPQIAEAAFHGLAATGESAAKERLIEMLQAEAPFDRTKELACTALAQLGEASTAQTLVEYREQPAALAALGRVGGAEQLEAIGELLASPPSAPDALTLRLHAVEALGHILERLRQQQQERPRDASEAQARAVQRLRAQLEAEDPQLIAAAAEALARAEGTAVLDSLRRVLNEESPRAAAVARGLGQIGDPAFVAALAALLPDASEQAGAMILEALGKIEPSALSEEVLAAVQGSLTRLSEGASHLWNQTTGHLTRGFGWILGNDDDETEGKSS